jgi:outer membrane PBP1 activator LpoA protein
LQRYLTLASPPARQAVAHYYLGLIARRQQRYAVALEELKLSVENSTDDLLTDQARADIEQIVRQHLSDEDLEQFTYQYDTVYPGDLLLLQLAIRHQEAGKVDEEIDTLQRFTANFPAHPRFQEVTERLRTLQEEVATGDAVKVGVLLPLSGDGGYFGQRALQGVELALATLQEHDPTLQISLVVRDTRRWAVVRWHADLVRDTIGVIDRSSVKRRLISPPWPMSGRCVHFMSARRTGSGSAPSQ